MLLFGSLALTFALTSVSFAQVTGTGVYAPPASGAFTYNGFVPPSIGGATYVDPVFGQTVRRLTTDHVHDDIYARNMWWNADGTRFLHRSTNGTAFADFWDVIDVATGTVTHKGLPNGGAISAGDGGFDPVDGNALYYFASDGIHKITLNPGGTWSDAVYFTPPGGAGLKPLGSTLNWFDASGRYMLVRYGEEPSVHLYDRNNMGAGPYGNPIDGSNYVGSGSYVGITPDGKYLVGYDSRSGVGFGKMGQGVSWSLDHGNRTIAGSPNIFWSVCGDHGSFLSASDGRNYMIVYDCYGQAGLWRVDITNNANGLNESQQQQLPGNQLLIGFTTWSDFGHVSTMAIGDWAFVATEDGGDTFNSGSADGSGNIGAWHAFRQEIVAINVVSGQIQRLAHHRSRSINDGTYYSQPRLSASWRGNVVGFASNFGQAGGGSPVVDIYAIPFGASGGVTAPPVSTPSTPTPVTQQPQPTAPLKAPSLGGVEGEGAQVTVRWQRNSTSESGFAIERSPVSLEGFVPVGTTGPGATAFTDTGIAAGTIYCYRARAFDGAAFSDYSGVACGSAESSVSLAVSLSRHTVKPGDAVQVSLTATNPGPAVDMELYFAIVVPFALSTTFGCPAGDGAYFLADDFATVLTPCLITAPASSLKPLSLHKMFGSGMSPTTDPAFFSFTWPSWAPDGTYVFIVFAAPTGTYDAGFDVGAITVLGSDWLTSSH